MPQPDIRGRFDGVGHRRGLRDRLFSRELAGALSNRNTDRCRKGTFGVPGCVESFLIRLEGTPRYHMVGQFERSSVVAVGQIIQPNW